MVLNTFLQIILYASGVSIPLTSTLEVYVKCFEFGLTSRGSWFGILRPFDRQFPILTATRSASHRAIGMNIAQSTGALISFYKHDEVLTLS